jgi:uncharacterized repeat protein (TIGR03803 family)
MKSINVLVLAGVLLAISPVVAQAAITLTTLVSFTGTNGVALGHAPESLLVQGRDGSFYGTTLEGGTNGAPGYGYGTVFKVTTDGTLTTLVSFNNTNGAYPQAGLLPASDGNFYGSTTQGTNGIGTLFQMTPSGTLTSLFSFDETNGADPNGLIQGNDGLLYGTAYYGGLGFGTVFNMTTNGAFTILASFNYTNGSNPQCDLTQTGDGNFYGTTVYGGTNGGWGTIFQATTNCVLNSLFSFNGADGANPVSTLTPDPDGALYGTTDAGGINFGGTPYTGDGTIFKVTTNGQLTTLHFFTGSPGDGAVPEFDGLSLGSDGNFYGTTFFGGMNNAGTVFRISPGGDYTNLYSFGNSPAGNLPVAGLIQGNDGNFYGTTAGDTNNGTVYRLAIPLNLPANQISAINIAGSNVLVTVPAVSAETYQLQCCSSLAEGAWSNVVGASAISVGGALTLTNLGGFTPSSQFYRFAIIP